MHSRQPQTGSDEGREPHRAVLRAEVFDRVGKPLPASFQAGYPPKMPQEIMGHASITTTLDLYGHLYPGEMDRYADRLNEAAGMSDAAKMRPDDHPDEDDDEQEQED